MERAINSYYFIVSVGQGFDIAVSCGVGRRHGSDPALLWLWHRLAATAPIRPLAQEPPYAMGVALKKTKKILISFFSFFHSLSFIEV